MRNSLALIALVALLAACGGDEHGDLKTWMTDSAKDLRGHVPPLPQIKVFPVIAYDAGALPDPFAAAKLETAKPGGGSGIKPDMNRRREPLEAYPLETLKMVGAMQSKGHPIALVSAAGTLFQVRTGNYLGQNFGVVTKVTESEISLKELIEDTNGDWVERVSTLQLQEQETKK